ncbi:MAG TPA: ATP-binding protein [Burkholderiales bacterium]|nr:ATP-binding protein [Burkholderiales bacterium]
MFRIRAVSAEPLARAAANRAPAEERLSIRRRIVLVVMATAGVALMAACVALLLLDLRSYHAALVADAETQAQIVGRASVAALGFDDPMAATENLSLLKTRPGISAGALYNTKGVLFATYARSPASATGFPPLPEADGNRVQDGELVLWKRVVSDGEILGTVYLRADYGALSHVASYALVAVVVLAGAMLLALAVSAWLQRSISAPLMAVRDVARQVVETRDFSLRAPKERDDELGYLADAFNDMLAEIERRTSALEQSNRTLEQAEEALSRLNAELEERVGQRTQQLEAANKELESFSYSVSHDLRAPVRAIAGFSKMLAESHAAHLDAEGQRKLGIVRSEAARMGALIDDLLAFSRLGRQSVQKAAVDMEELVRINFEALRSSGGAEPELHLGMLPKAIGDRSLLAQVWINLLSNAMKFSSKREHPRIEVSAISDDREYTYFVRDNGAGFDPKYGQKLFGVFQRLHHAEDFPGTGVGLALVHRIVTRHGGRVWAEGEPDKGATFYFTLPKEADGTV